MSKGMNTLCTQVELTISKILEAEFKVYTCALNVSFNHPDDLANRDEKKFSNPYK